jgi:hypothetical protein
MAVVTITATGLNLATAPDNFTIAIVDYLGATTLYATNISRSTLISGYNVTISPGDVTIRATSTGVCGSSADIDVSTLALQSYRPSPIEGTTFGGSPDYISTTGDRDGGGSEYIIGQFDIYPFMSVADFSLIHVSTTGAVGLSATGGPFVPPTLEVMADGTLDTIALLVGYTRNSYTLDATINTSIYRVTYIPTGLSRDVNYYWAVGAQP